MLASFHKDQYVKSTRNYHTRWNQTTVNLVVLYTDITFATCGDLSPASTLSRVDPRDEPREYRENTRSFHRATSRIATNYRRLVLPARETPLWGNLPSKPIFPVRNQIQTPRVLQFSGGRGTCRALAALEGLCWHTKQRCKGGGWSSVDLQIHLFPLNRLAKDSSVASRSVSVITYSIKIRLALSGGWREKKGIHGKWIWWGNLKAVR